MPGTGATPVHAYPIGPAWATYRLPGPASGTFTAREVGIGFEGEPGDGSNPPAGGDPPKPTEPPKPPAPTPPATGEGEPDADGMTTDAGRRALAAERQKAGDLKKELDELKAAHATDADKHDAEVKAAAAKERDEFWAGRIRSAEVRSALRAKGLTDDKQLNLAANAPELSALKVDEEGRVADLDKSIDAFVKDYPALFTAPKPGGQPTRGPQAPSDERPKNLGDAIAARLGTQPA